MSPDNGALDMVREEVAELLTEMESALLALEGDPGETRLINRIFRAVHTIKGAANMFEFREAAGLAHELENLLDLVRQGVMEVHKGFLEACLQAKDILWPLFQRPVSEASQEAAQGLLGVLRQVTSTPSPPSEPSESSEPAPGSDLPGPAPAPSGLERFHIEFKLKGEDVLVHIDPKAILDELRGLGRVVVRADAGELSDLDALAPESCVLGWEIELDTDAGEDAVRDVFIFAEEYAEFAISWAVETPAPEEAREPLAVAPATPIEQELEPEQEGPGLADEDPDPWSSLKTEPQRPGTQDNEEPQAGVRVDAAKLDDLVALVGELVIAQAQLGIVAARLSDPELDGVSEEVERLGNGLRDQALSLRMRPIGATFDRYRRLVRDLAMSQDKEVELLTQGADTELDKTVIDKLGEALSHVLANAMDHGIETPAQRQQAGKPGQGKILLEAEHSGGHVYIRVRDDGQGLNREAIANRAKERGIIDSDEGLSDREVYDLVFSPGFSTAKEVSDVSGRGVGMDVVRKSIENLRGTVDLFGEPGQGLTVSIKLPLTLAIIEGLLVRVEQEHYVIPLALVEECVELTEEQRKESSGKRTINLRGAIVPYVRLRDWFQVGGKRPEIQQIIITSEAGERTGILVDEVIGQQQTVIKSLGKAFAHVEEVSGATIRGDGTMALILDVPCLLRKVREEAGAALAG